jgi:short subunit fatty acids transporter
MTLHTILISVQFETAGNLYQFLKYNCRSICDIFHNDGEIKILRIDADNQNSQEKSTKKKQKRKPTAPKLKYEQKEMLIFLRLMNIFKYFSVFLVLASSTRQLFLA